MTLRDLVIIGAGGFGREVHQWVTDLNRAAPTFHVVGFVDDHEARGTVHGLPVLGDVGWLDAHRDVAATIAIGSPASRAKILARLATWEISTPSIVHPRAMLGMDVAVGDAAIVCPGVIATCDIHIGRAVILNLDLTIGHDAVIGDLCTLSPGVHVSGYAKLGTGCDVGTGATFVPGVEVGAWSVIGAGAVVSANLPGDVVAVGVPARAIKTRAPGWQNA